MKLLVTQIILSVLIILAACSTVWWMVFKTTPSEMIQVPGLKGIMENVQLFPEHELLYTVARYGSGLLVFLGLIMLVSCLLQTARVNERNIRLTITQAIAGVLFAIFGVFTNLHGFPHEYVSRSVFGGYNTLHILINPDPSYTNIFLTIGLAFSLSLFFHRV